MVRYIRISEVPPRLVEVRGRFIHISDVPPKLMKVRDSWRHFWQWIPIAGWLYNKYYQRIWLKWERTLPDGVIGIDHSE